MKFIKALFVSTLFFGCGSTSDMNSDQKTENYSYSFSETFNLVECKTGEQKFASKKSYCTGLKNDELNNYCAKESRDRAYNRTCL